MTDSTDNARGPERIWWNAAPMPHSYTSTVQFAGGVEYVRADLAPATMGAAKVKSLDWVKHPSREMWRCDSMLGTYKAFGVGPTPSWDFDDFFGKVQISSVTNTLEAAKAAAQADYETRIRSALEPCDPLGDPRVVALRDAAQAMMDRWPHDQPDYAPLYEEAQSLRAALAALSPKGGNADEHD